MKKIDKIFNRSQSNKNVQKQKIKSRISVIIKDNDDLDKNFNRSQSNKNVQKQKIKSRTSLIIEKHLVNEFERLHQKKYLSNV